MSAEPGFFVIRVPLLPLDVLAEWAAAPLAGSASPSDISAHIAYLRESYRGLLADPIVREAIFVASPDLDAAIDGWLLDPDTPRARDVERALTRYLTRMASRPTPFGMFSSVAVAGRGETTALTVSPHSDGRRQTRLDIDYLNQVVDALVVDPSIQPWLRYRPADTVCRIAGSWRYVETRLKDKARTHHLVSIEDNDAVSAALARARTGATPDELTQAVRQVGVEDADGFVSALIESRLLQPDLACPVTGDAPAAAIAARLSSVPGAEPLVCALEDAVQRLRAMDAGPLAAGRDAYRTVAARLATLPGKAELARLFQVDMARPAGGTLDADAIALIRRGGETLLNLCPAPGADEELARVKHAWRERYEGREVPLLEALDADCGIGSALGGGARGSSTLLDGLRFPDTAAPTAAWGERETLLLSLIVRSAGEDNREVQLTDTDLRVLRPKTPAQLPQAFAVNATLFQEPDRAPQVLVHSIIGPPVARLIGRFCLVDDAIDAGVRQLVAAEEALDPDAVHAEIVHLPEGRAGNVILRPVLRAYEITAMGASGAEASRQLPLSDLTVQLTAGVFIVRSTRLDARVVPRLTTAHNFAGWGVGAYRFLCLMQADGNRGSAWWSWGALEASPFLPRIRVGDVILSRATWKLSKPEMAALQKPDVAQRYDAVQALRRARRLPRWVVLADGDNELVVDLENLLAVDSLLQVLKERDEAALREWFPGPDAAVARGVAGRYAHEVIVPFIRSGEAPVTGTVQPPTAGPKHDIAARAPGRRKGTTADQRSFLPGSQWLFAKIYGGTATADRLLTDVVGPASRALLAKGTIDRWFFIRYADPEEHVRWRVELAAGVSPASARRLMEHALAAARDQEWTWRGAFDTYEREIERYGGPQAMALAERWFHADSAAVVDLLAALDARGGGDDRWLATLLSIDRLLTDFGFDLERKAAVMRDARERFAVEFKVDAAFRRALADRLRPVAKTLNRLLASGPERRTVLAEAAAILGRRSRQSRRVFAGLERLEQQGTVSHSLVNLSFSYVHMAVNRLTRSEPRMHELVLYDFLAQTYASQLARARAVHGDSGR